MTASVSTAERTKIARVLALLSSPHPGEVAAAAAAAQRLITSTGGSWEELLAPPPAPTRPAAPTSSPPRAPVGDLDERLSWRELALGCLQYRHLLNDWEAGFLDNLGRFSRLSPKQQHSLDQIVTRLRASGCGGPPVSNDDMQKACVHAASIIGTDVVFEVLSSFGVKRINDGFAYGDLSQDMRRAFLSALTKEVEAFQAEEAAKRAAEGFAHRRRRRAS